MVQIPDQELTLFVRSIFENFPEYAVYSLSCTSYKYEQFLYIFEDVEDGEVYTVDLQKALDGAALWIQRVFDGKTEINAGNLFQVEDSVLDPGCVDAIALDEILQLSIFKEIIYG